MADTVYIPLTCLKNIAHTLKRNTDVLYLHRYALPQEVAYLRKRSRDPVLPRSHLALFVRSSSAPGGPGCLSLEGMFYSNRASNRQASDGEANGVLAARLVMVCGCQRARPQRWASCACACVCVWCGKRSTARGPVHEYTPLSFFSDGAHVPRAYADPIQHPAAGVCSSYRCRVL